MVWNRFREEDLQLSNRFVCQFILAVDDRFEVFEEHECFKKVRHLTIIDSTIVKPDSIDIGLEEFRCTFQSLTVPCAQCVVGQSESILIYVREDR